MHYPAPESAIDYLKWKRFDQLDCAPDNIRVLRYEVGIAVHKADITAVGHYLENIATEKFAFAIRSASPVQHRATCKMNTAADQSQPFANTESIPFPQYHGRVGTHHPFAV